MKQYSDEEKTERFFDESGKLKQYPTKRPLRIIALARFTSFFEDNKDYTQKEVNSIITDHIAFSDHELIRRELIENGFLCRTPDGSRYWKKQN